ELDAADFAADHHTAEPFVTNEDVRTRAKQEVRQLDLARGEDRVRELIGCARTVEQVCRSTDLEGRVRSERHVPLDPVPAHPRNERFLLRHPIDPLNIPESDASSSS